MNRLFPLSLAGRTLLILLIGLTLSHVLSILVFTSEKLEPMVVTSEEQILERMATITRLLVDLPAPLHEPVLAAMNRSGMRIEVLHHTTPEAALPATANDEPMRRRLEERVGMKQVRVLAVTMAEPDWDHPHGAWHHLLFTVELGLIRLMHDTVMDRELRAWVDLPVGHRLLLTSRPTEHHVPLFRHATLSMSIMTVAILLFSLLIARRTTLPLRRVVQAAETFGQDVYAAPLPERGASEVVTMARAFNRMNRSIREFVEDRLRMIAAISHDLRTPLTKLKLMAEFVGDDATRARMVATLDEMEAMLAATLSFARDATFVEPKQRVNLNGLLSALCQDLADTGLAASFEEGDKTPFLCRPLAMKRALSNLIHNAVKYGGAAHVALSREETRLVVVIRDPGPGIPESEWENVFKPFLRLEPSRSPDTGGVGLGLSIAASVIRDHDGVIRFGHPPEGGFITWVELPLAGQRGKNS